MLLFPIAIAAIILGHMSRSEIRKSNGRLKGDGMATAGLVMGYGAFAIIPFILIIAAIAIPNLLRARMAANESSAVHLVSEINTAEVTYRSAYPDVGFTCTLSNLGGNKSSAASPDTASTPKQTVISIKSSLIPSFATKREPEHSVPTRPQCSGSTPADPPMIA